MNIDRRTSFEPQNFTKTLLPLPVLDRQSLMEPEELVIGSSTLSPSSPAFVSKRFLNYVSSPKFLTPKRIFNKSEVNLKMTNSKTLKLKASFPMRSRSKEIEKDQ